MATNMDLFNLEDLDFELDPIFVIRLENKDTDWFLERIEFGATDDLVREIFWTSIKMRALHFHDYDDVLSFASTQFGGRRVSVQELI